jgi:hypothetical protein
MQVLLFMDTQPDGYVCPKCNVLFGLKPDGTPAERPLAMVL